MARTDVTDQDFKDLTIGQKLKLLSKKLRNACNENKTFPIMFVRSMISKLYFCMFNTFWLLYLTSQVGIYYDEQEAK